MLLKERIEEDRKQALLEGNKIKRTILGVLIGNLTREGINSICTDEKIIREVKKLIEDNKAIGSIEENVYLECYLPQMLSDEELEKHIKYFCAGTPGLTKPTMGEVMKYLKEEFPGLMMEKKQVN